MAVPGRRNGMIEDDEDIEENGLFEEEGLVELDDETPPHLRDLAAATQLGDLEALRLALGPLITPLSLSLSLSYCFYCLAYFILLILTLKLVFKLKPRVSSYVLFFMSYKKKVTWFYSFCIFEFRTEYLGKRNRIELRSSDTPNLTTC